MAVRTWQSEALEKYLQSDVSDFTVTATPGAGKTRYALIVAKKLIAMKKVTRIVIVCPTDHLRVQWQENAEQYGLVLDRTAGNNRKIKPNADGYITTYAEVAMKPILHERRVSLPHKTFVIFDEIHHAGDGLSWGEAVREAFTPAVRRLHLTGTPFRTSPYEKIPFVRYEEQQLTGNTTLGSGEEGNLNTPHDVALVSQSDYAYTYGDALRDGVVRPVIFAAYSGLTRWRDSAGDVLTAELGQNLAKKDEEMAWRTALKPDSKWVETVIKNAHQRLVELRKSTTPDAGCLILASDQDRARQYAQVVKRITGESPTIVLSDDPQASKKISRYNDDSSKKFIVAVRMVSEGVDIPRLSVLVWLTSYRTPLFFAQAVGRVIRSRKRAETATVFIPTVRSLLTLAASMETERNHIIGRKPDFVIGDSFDEDFIPERGEGVGKPELLHAEARFGHVLVGGKSILPQQFHTPTLHTDTSETNTTHAGNTYQGSPSPVDLDNVDPFLGLPGLLTPEQEAMLLAEKELTNITIASTNDEVSEKRLVEEKEKEKLKEEIRTLAKKLSYITGKPMRTVNHEINQLHTPGTKNDRATLETLKHRRDWLLHQTAHR